MDTTLSQTGEQGNERAEFKALPKFHLLIFFVVYFAFFCYGEYCLFMCICYASEMTYIVSGGALNSSHSLPMLPETNEWMHQWKAILPASVWSPFVCWNRSCCLELKKQSLAKSVPHSLSLNFHAAHQNAIVSSVITLIFMHCFICFYSYQCLRWTTLFTAKL